MAAPSRAAPAATSFFLSDRLDDGLVSRITDFDPAEDILTVTLQVGNDPAPGDFRLEARQDGIGNDLYLGDDLIAEILSTRSFTLEDIRLVVQLGQEAFTGGATDITIQGNSFDNVVTGGDGNELISMGVSGSDSGDGGAGNDTIIADGTDFFDMTVDVDMPDVAVTLGQDTLNGGAGDDVIISRNRNILTGGEGADVFQLRQDPDDDSQDNPRIPAAIITDFDPAEYTIVRSRITAPDLSALVFVPFADGTGSTIELGDQIIARVTVVGDQPLGLDTVTMAEFF